MQDFGYKDDEPKLKVNETFYSGNEVVAYYDEILNALLEEEKSLQNKAKFIGMSKILIKKKEERLASGVVYQALERYKNDPAISRLKTDIFLSLKDYDRALKSVTQSLEEHPMDVSLMLLKARVFNQAGEEELEEKTYKDILAVPIQDYEISRAKLIAMRRLADIYFKAGNYDLAREFVEKILHIAPDESAYAMYFTILRRLGKPEASKTAKEDFARYRRARSYFDRAQEYELENKFNLALSNYRKGLEVYPDEPGICMKVGSILMYRKNWYSRAEEYIRKAVKLDPDQTSYRTNLVICLKNQGKYEEAYKHAKIAEQMDPLSNVYHLRKLALKLNKTDEFEQIIMDSVENDPEGRLPALRYELGLYYENRGDREKADEWYQKALDLFIKEAKNFPDDWNLYMEMGNCYKRLGEYDKAERAFKAAEQTRGAELTDVYENLVELYQKTRQPEKSTPYLKKLITEKPGRLVNYIDLGINYLSRLTSSMRKKRKDV